MNTKKLDTQISLWTKELDQQNRKILLARLSSLKSVYPFNEYEYRLMFLLDKKVITFKEYEGLRNNYIKQNPYLELYGIAPRIFGEIWAQQHLADIDNRFLKSSKKTDLKFQGEYDLYLKKGKKIIKVEVKACRAINTKLRGKLVEKALAFKSKEPFWMNFQQLKLNLVDVFIFVAVWIDKIQYWVLSDEEVRKHPSRSHQHRGGIEFQIGVTDKNIKKLDNYLVKPKDLVKIVVKKS